MSRGHKKLEKNIGLMAVFIVIVVSLGGLVEILPLIFQDQVRVPADGVKPYPALQLAGRDIFIREGCYGCHSQMIRPFRSETERYGAYSVAGESVYDRPFQWGSKRTGPDLARVGGRYSDEWHVIHLMNPRDVVPESNMPGYPWLLENTVDPELIEYNIHHLFEHRVELLDLDEDFGYLGEDFEDPFAGADLLGDLLRLSFEPVVLVELGQGT